MTPALWRIATPVEAGAIHPISYVSLDRRTIEGTAYDTTYQVDNQGRLTEMVTPGNLAVS